MGREGEPWHRGKEGSREMEQQGQDEVEVCPAFPRNKKVATGGGSGRGLLRGAEGRVLVSGPSLGLGCEIHGF